MVHGLQCKHFGVLVRVCCKSGRVEEWNDVDMMHDGRLGLTVMHRGGMLHLRRTEVTTVEITMSAEARKPAVLVEAAPYLRSRQQRSDVGRLIRMDSAGVSSKSPCGGSMRRRLDRPLLFARSPAT